MRELRTHLTSEAEFVDRVNRLQRPEGYRLLGSFEEGEDQAAAAAGFRPGNQLARGFHIYIDDLSTRAALRGRGHAGALMDWIEAEARRLGCGQIDLDSGVQLERLGAHRLYFNKRMRISSYHFVRQLS